MKWLANIQRGSFDVSEWRALLGTPAGSRNRGCGSNVSLLEERRDGMGAKQWILSTATLGVVLISGCRVDTNDHGDNKNVRVATPFGGVQVKTNDTGGVEGIGLPVYPGAELVKKRDKDNGSADVNLSFGKFQLRVKAANYQTPDSPDKVSTFYKDAMKRYGTVIECNHDQPVGTPTSTDEGLTCSDGGKKHVSTDADASGKTELKTGSKQHQHIVAIEPNGGGTKFGLVALDLPGNLSIGDGDTNQRQ
jgi:hypothetical protein